MGFFTMGKAFFDAPVVNLRSKKFFPRGETSAYPETSAPSSPFQSAAARRVALSIVEARGEGFDLLRKCPDLVDGKLLTHDGSSQSCGSAVSIETLPRDGGYMNGSIA
ncbi:MAG: hypothetical protein R2710_19490 [Acidimicrobiales bacterium]